MTHPNNPTAGPDRPTGAPDSEPTTPLSTTPPTLVKTTPLKTPPQDTTPATDPASPTADRLPRRRPLFATILWGALMLALAAFTAARELVPGGFDLVTWLLAAVVGIGLLLVGAGIAAASRRAG
ncbi:hypothetical protein E3O42_01280 [Cryobacterium adonitolivorans]|uniref:DUF2530 domain-containing protein n=1 Tax=Cryobacterium adonitolivorans TaxID=1259189 RepID=A0A4R8WHX0_9MICO|nr:hypothetical protein [Cryobacterium adonitolivorans]TFC07039.1 hypothetical protein E3O42_01280 [Cryobacterium adonitolivorans]